MTDREMMAVAYALVYGLVGSIAALVGLGVFLKVEGQVKKWTAAVLMPLMVLGIALSSALSGRDLKYAGFNVELVAFGATEGSAAILRLLTAVLMGLCAAAIVSRGFRREATARLGGQVLFYSFLAYYLSNNIVNSIFGTLPNFSHHTVYVLFVFTAVYLCREDPFERFVRLAKLALFALMLTSLVAAVAVPSLAVQPEYKGWIPGVHSRLWGLGSNPNSIGPLAFVLILLELLVPETRRFWRVAIVASALAVFLFAQSKTAWAAALALTPLLAWYRGGRASGGGMKMGFALALLLSVLVLLLGVAFMGPGKIADKLSGSQIGSDVSTLSGRLEIWAAAVRAWQENPLFGFGPLAWGPYHRAIIGLPNAFSAHNQFFQSLSVAGSLGIVTLLAYVVSMGVLAWRTSTQTQGVSLALFLFVLVRCATEAPLSAATLFNGEIVTQILLFRMLLLPRPHLVPARDQATATHAWLRSNNAT
jgi:O-antigen ligase